MSREQAPVLLVDMKSVLERVSGGESILRDAVESVELDAEKNSSDVF